MPYPTTFDYYISTTGSDSNDGTIVSPWAITALQTQAATIAGKVVGLLDGTYRAPTSTGTNSAYVAIPAGAAGTSGTRTVIAAVNPREAILTDNNGAGSYSVNRCYWLSIDAAWIEVWGLFVTDMGGREGIAVGQDNLLFQDCKFTDFDLAKSGKPEDNYAAIRSQSIGLAANLIVRNCRFEDMVVCNACGGNFTGSNWLIENCTFIDVEGSMIYHKREAGTYEAKYCFFYTSPGATGVSHSPFGATPLHGDDTLADGTPVYVTGPNKAHHNILVGQEYLWGITGEQGMNIIETLMYSNTFVLRNAGGAGGNNTMNYHQGAQAVSPTIAANQDFYNNICTYVDPNTHAPGTVSWIDFRAETPLATVMRTFDYNGYYNYKIHQWSPANTWTGSAGLTSVRALGSYEAASEILTTHGFSNVNGTEPADFRLISGNNIGSGRIGGVSGGAVCNRGAWDGVDRIYGTNVIGADFTASAPAPTSLGKSAARRLSRLRTY